MLPPGSGSGDVNPSYPTTVAVTAGARTMLQILEALDLVASNPLVALVLVNGFCMAP